MTSAGWDVLPPALDEAAAAILSDCQTLGRLDAARAAITAARAAADAEIYGWTDDGALIAVYGLRNDGLSFSLLWLAVAPAWRGQRYGRSVLADALRRCGRKPMTVEVDEGTLGWFQRVGFKMVGRKPTAEGGYRYRLGWYAPRRPDEPGFGAH